MAELSREWLTSLDDYVRGFQEEAHVAAGLAAEHLQNAVRDKARMLPGWDELADDIQVWSDDGILVVGLQDQRLVSQAFALEYGDETAPPSPLFRTINSIVDEAGEVYMGHLADAGMADRE